MEMDVHSLIMSRGFVLLCSELTHSIKLVTSVLQKYDVTLTILFSLPFLPSSHFQSKSCHFLLPGVTGSLMRSGFIEHLSADVRMLHTVILTHIDPVFHKSHSLRQLS